MMKQLLLSLLLLTSAQALAHGEDRPGPHGGFIKMPGAFHTEVVLDGKNKVKVYLIDMEWKNPTITDSAVEALHSSNKEPAKCIAKENYFECTFPASVNLTKKGQLTLQTQREKAKGNAAIYDLPLKIKKTEGGHGGHH